jgi:hypothetical protein
MLDSTGERRTAGVRVKRTEGSSLSVKLLLDCANLSLPAAKLRNSWSWLCEAAIL